MNLSDNVYSFTDCESLAENLNTLLASAEVIFPSELISAQSFTVSSGVSSLAAIRRIVLASEAVILPSELTSPFNIIVYSSPHTNLNRLRR